MPGRNRSAAKAVKAVASNVTYGENKSSSNAGDSIAKVMSSSPGPKHFPMPDTYSENELFYEIFVTFFGLIALATQYLNLYRTVWWLPHSYTNTAMNFYLIDPHLVGFSVIILSRRCLWIILKLFFNDDVPLLIWTVVGNIIKIILSVTVLGLLLWCGYNVMLKQTQVVTVLYLCYPLCIYFIVFGLEISPFLEAISWPMDKSGKVNKIKHTCSMSADVIREEVCVLKDDFNYRLKQLMFNSLLSAYYTSFIPCCFAQESWGRARLICLQVLLSIASIIKLLGGIPRRDESVLHYDLTWATQHALFVLVSSFTMYYIYYFPSKYCDTLHRTALHLGRWHKLEPRSTHVPHSLWSAMTLWQQGALVKHSKELFRAEGTINAAEPGNSTHSRFYTIFINPSVLLSLILAVEVTLVLTILILLINCSEWYRIISLGLILFSNYYTLFKLCREYLMLERVYHAEEVIQGRTDAD